MNPSACKFTYVRWALLCSGEGPQRSAGSLCKPPASVIAKALGYHAKTATRLITEASGTWSRYASGDHERRR